jgi:hypothetical protein
VKGRAFEARGYYRAAPVKMPDESRPSPGLLRHGRAGQRGNPGNGGSRRLPGHDATGKVDHPVEGLRDWADRGRAGLRDTIVEESARALRPRVLAALCRGDRVPFGPRVALDANGFFSEDRRIRWSDVTGVKVSHGMLCVESRGEGQGLKVPLELVANAELLRQVLDERAALVAAAAGRVPAGRDLPAQVAADCGRMGLGPLGGPPVCPTCAGPMQRGGVGWLPLLVPFGALGGLLAVFLARNRAELHGTELSCPKCGPISRGDLPSGSRRRARRGVFLFLVAALCCLGLGAVALLVLVAQ